MIVSAFNGTRRATGMFESCVRTGSYGLRDCADSVGSIIDIGANVGFFSLMARFLCPDAQVVSVEPDPTSYRDLVQNARHLRIQLVQAGLGDGQPIRRHEVPPAARGCYGTRFDAQGNGKDQCPSYALSRFVEVFGLRDLFIKIDCEGAERFLIGDPNSEQVIRESVGIGGEFHSLDRSTRDFEKWLHGLVGDTHRIQFFPAGGASCEFRAVRIDRSGPTIEAPKTRKIRFTQDVKMSDGRKWPSGFVAEEEYEFACHLVHCGYCEYIL